MCSVLQTSNIFRMSQVRSSQTETYVSRNMYHALVNLKNMGQTAILRKELKMFKCPERNYDFIGLHTMSAFLHTALIFFV